MKKLFFTSFFIILSTFYSFAYKAYVIRIHGAIDLGIPMEVKRGIKEANEAEADFIIFEVNTLGGRVDAAVEIKDAILESEVPTIAFIKNRAISAGALISLACDIVIMAHASSIGAATPVDGTGQKLPEKHISYMRAEMRSTLEANGRNPKIGEAMVDETIFIEGISDSGSLLTLTSQEALKLGIADTIMPELDSILQKYSIKTTVFVEQSIREKIVRLLTHPIVSPILMSLGMLGIIFELRSPGFGFPGIIGSALLTLFLLSHYVLRLVNWAEIILIFSGIVMLVVEFFVLPGFGIAGIAGILLLSVGVFKSMVPEMPNISDYLTASWGLLAFFIVMVIGVIVSYKAFVKSKAYKKVALGDENDMHMDLKFDFDDSIIGEEAEVVSVLRPSGKVEYNSKIYQAITRGDYIESGEKVKIIATEGNNLIVKKISHLEGG